MSAFRFYFSTPVFLSLSNVVRWLNTVITIPLLFLYSCSSDPGAAQAPPPPSLPVMEVRQATGSTYQEYPASVEGIVNVEIRPQVGGILDKVFADEGTFVKKGQSLFRINDQTYREQLNAARASLTAAQAAVENARLEVEKLKPLVQNHVVSDFQLKSANAAYRIALGNREQAKANVASAQINLGYTIVKAPVSGYLGRLLKKQGSLIGPADPQPVITLSDVHEVHAYFSLGENDFINFKNQYPGETLQEKLKKVPPVTLLLSDQSTFSSPGRIDMVDGQFDRNTGSVTLRASFPNAGGLLRSGNTAKIRLSLVHNNALIVPQEATMEIQDKIFVFAVNDSNKVSRLPISVDGTSGTDYLVKDGLKAGDRIVLKGIDHLQDGQVIKPENTSPSDKKLAALTK